MQNNMLLTVSNFLIFKTESQNIILSISLYMQNYFSSFQRASWDLHTGKQDCNLAWYLKPEINKMYRLILGLNSDFMITATFLSSSIHLMKCNQPYTARGEKLLLICLSAAAFSNSNSLNQIVWQWGVREANNTYTKREKEKP